MSIVVRCNQCKKELEAPDELAGQEAQCPCGATIKVPQKKAPVLQERNPRKGTNRRSASERYRSRQNSSASSNKFILPGAIAAAVLATVIIMMIVNAGKEKPTASEPQEPVKKQKVAAREPEPQKPEESQKTEAPAPEKKKEPARPKKQYPTEIVIPPAPASDELEAPARQLNETTCWFGNTYGGANGKWVQLGMGDIYVFPDGRIVSNAAWDEAGRAIGFYKDGDVIGKVDDYSALTGGFGVTASDRYIFALRSERKHQEGDPFWKGVARYTLDGKPATWPGAEGRVRNVLFINPPTEKGGKDLTGVAVYGDELFLADPVSKAVKVFDQNTMEPKREFRLTPETASPGKIETDAKGNLWVIQRVEKEPAVVRQYSLDGTYKGTQIDDGDSPAALTVDNDGNLLVAYSGELNQVLRYDMTGTPKVIGTLGEKGGVFYADQPGLWEPDRFLNPIGLGVDANDNLYVACAGAFGGGGGGSISKFTPDKEHLWTLQGLTFIDGGAFDPGDPTQAFTKGGWFELDYSKQTQPGWPHPAWKLKAWTYNPRRYPDDPRNHVRQESPYVFRYNGERFLALAFGHCYMGIYRFDGYTAVPAAFFGIRDYKGFPPENPYKEQSLPYLWVDANGDGSFQEDEFSKLADTPAPTIGAAQYVDDTGTYWYGEENSHIIHGYKIDSLNEHGVPVYTLENHSTTDLSPISPDITHVRALQYVSETDTMYVAVYSNERPKRHWLPMGREIRRYDNWSTNPVDTVTIPLPYKHAERDEGLVRPMSMGIAGDYAFVAYICGADTRKTRGEVLAFRTNDGGLVGAFRPTGNVGSTSGWIDFIAGALHARELEDGRIVVSVEEDHLSKIIYYLWKPSDTAPAQPQNLTAYVGDGIATITWKEVPGAENYKLKRADHPDGPFEIIAVDACRQDPLAPDQMLYTDVDAQNGNTYYYTVSAVNGRGESPTTEVLKVTLDGVDNLAANGGFEGDPVDAFPTNWHPTAGQWAITDETAFNGEQCLKGTYNRSTEQPFGPSVWTNARITPGRYHVEVVLSSNKPIAGGEVGVRTPRTHLAKAAGGQDLLQGTNKIVVPLGERNGRNWWWFYHDLIVPDGISRLEMDLVYPFGSGHPDPTTVWADNVKIYKYKTVKQSH